MRFTKSAGNGLISPEAMARSTHSENFDDWEATYLLNLGSRFKASI